MVSPDAPTMYKSAPFLAFFSPPRGSLSPYKGTRENPKEITTFRSPTGNLPVVQPRSPRFSSVSRPAHVEASFDAIMTGLLGRARIAASRVPRCRVARQGTKSSWAAESLGGALRASRRAAGRGAGAAPRAGALGPCWASLGPGVELGGAGVWGLGPGAIGAGTDAHIWAGWGRRRPRAAGRGQRGAGSGARSRGAVYAHQGQY